MTKLISKGLLQDELEKCKDHTGKMFKLPILTSIWEVDGELYCEVEGYTDVPEDLEGSNNTLPLH